jgi:hypothetical protein
MFEAHGIFLLALPQRKAHTYFLEEKNPSMALQITRLITNWAPNKRCSYLVTKPLH